MSLNQTVSEDLQKAMKARDEIRVSTLRFLRAGLQNLAIERKKKVLDDQEVLEVVVKLIKQHQDSIEGFRKGRREDLVQKEQAELTILQSYCGPELGEQELLTLIEEAIREAGASGPHAMGQVMKYLMPRVKGRADGQRVNSLVRTRLEKSLPD